MEKKISSHFLSVISHLIPIVLIFIISVLIRYPIFINNDHFFTSDEGVMANTIINLLNGGPIVFYYDYARYFGLTGGLLAVPFMYFLGFDNTMAFNLPATLFFSLYLWTLYLIAKTIIPSRAILVLVLLLFAPPFVSQMTTHNWPHIGSAFLGNLIFLFFIKIRMTDEKKGINIFLLFFSMGLAIYTYTFSLIYISVVFLLYALSYPKWNEIRQTFSFKLLVRKFKGENNKAKKLVYFLDLLIAIFFIAIIFSYIFGGFGIDIGGISVFQINNFHKPVVQLFVLVLLRIIVYRKDLVSLSKSIKNFVSDKIHGESNNFIFLGVVGFLLGLFPRILSILLGETSRGGQGFDVDFNPIKLVLHLWDICIRTMPKLFSLARPFQEFSFNSTDNIQSILSILAVQLLLLLLLAGFFILLDNRGAIKKILTLKAIKFDPLNIFIVLPFLTCLANLLVQNGSEPRYLFPMFGTIVIWLGVFVDKFQGKFKRFSILVAVIWVGFYSLETYKNYNDLGVANGLKPNKLQRIEIYDLIEFLNSKNIKTAYSTYIVSQKGTFLSGGKINISEFNNNPIAKNQKKRSLNDTNYAVIAAKKEMLIYQKYLTQNKIRFSVYEVAGYKVFWGFSGDQAKINKLRSLIPYNI